LLRDGFIDEGAMDVDVYQRDGKVVVEASVPGFKEGEINLQLHKGILSITAEHREDSATNESRDGANYYRRERRHGSLARRIALPGIVGEAPVEATLHDGVLRIEIEAPANEQPQKIVIKSA
jgi:HSP20 family protein